MANPIKVIKLTGVSGSLEGKADVVHTHELADINDAGTAASSDSTDFATAAQGTLATNAIQAGTLSSVNADISDATLIDTTDSRLSDARTPTTHSHTLSQITDSGSAAGLDVATVGNAAAGEVVTGDDTRLSDDRDPTAHTHTLADISDSGTAAAADTTAFATAAEGILAGTALQDASAFATAAEGILAGTALQSADLGTAASSDVGDFATAAEGILAGTALQDASAFATSAEGILAGTALQDASAFATAAEGILAGTALQSADLGTAASSAVGDFATAAQGVLADNADTKLAGIDAGATDDQTGAEIKAAYIGEAKAFTDAQYDKLDSIVAGATADQTGAEIKTAYQAEPNAFTDAQFSKLSGMDDNAADDQTGAEIKAAYETELKAFTDTQFDKLATIDTNATVDQTASDIRTLGFFDITNDGTGSGLDADLLDGLDSTDFATAAQGIKADNADTKLAGIDAGATDDQTAAEILTAVKTVDGTGSGLDADLLDGLDSTAFATSAQGVLADNADTKLAGIDAGATDDQTPAEILTAVKTVDGTGSGLDADLLDGLDATAFATAAQGTTAEEASTYKGNFNPTSGGGFGAPNLNTITSSVGDTYYVTADATYNFVSGTDPALVIGDVLMAKSAGVLNDAGDWILMSAGGGGATDLSGLTDVTTAAVTDKFALMADGAAYVGRALVEADISDLGTYLSTVNVADLSAIGTPSGTTYLRGDNTWATVPTPDDTAYGVSWNGDTTAAPSKNAVYDKIETLGGSGGGGLTWEFDTSTSAGAGQGEFRYNAAFDPTAVSVIYLSTACTESGTYSAGGFTNKMKSGDVMHVVGPSSGIHSSWNVTGTPTNNGSYISVPVSSSSTDYGFASDGEQCSLIYSSTGAAATEGTSVLSTGETGGTKFLGEDGDGTCSWQTIGSGGGTTQGSSSTYDISAVARSSTPDARGNYSVDLQMQGNADDVAAGTHSALIGGSFNSAAGTHGFITAGTGNTIPQSTAKASILSSDNCSMANGYGYNSVILAHGGNALVTTMSAYNSAIIGGQGHTLLGGMGGGGYCAILAGQTNSGNYADNSIILGGDNNNISYSSNCVIAGTRVKATGVPLGRLNGVFAFADNTAADYTITQEKTANFRVANGMHITAPLFIDERASALADIAGRGQIWVKTATPNELWFTDDAGSDRPISEGVYTVATLPTGVAGRRAFVTDSNNALSNHHGQTVSAGGANFVPVYHDGSAWHVG